MSKYKETYITIMDFAYLQDIGRPYEGFVIGLGYAFTYSSVINPPNFNGYSHAGDVPPLINRFKLVSHQYVDNSPEMIERSIHGITSNGAKIHIVRQGDTLTSIAKEYGVSIENLIKWNKISTPDKLQIGEKLIVSELSHDLLGDYLKQNPIREGYAPGISSDTPVSIPQLSAQQIIDIISSSASIHGYLPKTLLYNQAHEKGCFIYKNGGKYITRKMGYYGNQNQSAELISNYKTQFGNAITMNKGISALGTATGVVSLGIGISEIQNGNINPNSYNDVGVGALGVMASGASYFGGVEIPLVGEFVLSYGVMRVSWDLGELYGPSKWPGFYRQYRERKRQEKFFNTLQKEINESR